MQVTNHLITFKTDNRHADFTAVAHLLNQFGLSDGDAAMQKRIFENSHASLFAYDGQALIGCSRVLSDGISQAVIYNVAVDSKYHHLGIGSEMIRRLVHQYQQCNIILYTHPKTVGWYEKLGFERMNTGMAIYQADHREWMRKEGFLK
jgi:ribosomal protein S18 acetylase RimI-like enzyme